MPPPKKLLNNYKYSSKILYSCRDNARKESVKVRVRKRLGYTLKFPVVLVVAKERPVKVRLDSNFRPYDVLELHL